MRDEIAQIGQRVVVRDNYIPSEYAGNSGVITEIGSNGLGRVVTLLLDTPIHSRADEHDGQAMAPRYLTVSPSHIDLYQNARINMMRANIHPEPPTRFDYVRWAAERTTQPSGVSISCVVGARVLLTNMPDASRHRSFIGSMGTVMAPNPVCIVDPAEYVTVHFDEQLPGLSLVLKTEWLEVVSETATAVETRERVSRQMRGIRSEATASAVGDFVCVNRGPMQGCCGQVTELDDAVQVTFFDTESRTRLQQWLNVPAVSAFFNEDQLTRVSSPYEDLDLPDATNELLGTLSTEELVRLEASMSAAASPRILTVSQEMNSADMMQRLERAMRSMTVGLSMEAGLPGESATVAGLKMLKERGDQSRKVKPVAQPKLLKGKRKIDL